MLELLKLCKWLNFTLKCPRKNSQQFHTALVFLVQSQLSLFLFSDKTQTLSCLSSKSSKCILFCQQKCEADESFGSVWPSGLVKPHLLPTARSAMWWDCSGLYSVRAENPPRKTALSISGNIRSTAQQFSWKEKLSLTPSLWPYSAHCPSGAQGFLPLVLLASLSFQRPLKVKHTLNRQIRRLISSKFMIFWITSKICHHSNYSYCIQIQKVPSSLTLFMFHETEDLYPIY